MVSVEFIPEPKVYFAKDLGGAAKYETWEIGFFATLAANDAKQRGPIRLPAARWFRADRGKTKDEAIEALKEAAEAAGYCKIEVFKVGRILNKATTD